LDKAEAAAKEATDASQDGSKTSVDSTPSATTETKALDNATTNGTKEPSSDAQQQSNGVCDGKPSIETGSASENNNAQPSSTAESNASSGNKASGEKKV